MTRPTWTVRRYLAEWCESDWTADGREPVYAQRACASLDGAQRIADREAQRTGIDWAAVREQQRARGPWRTLREWRREGASGWYPMASAERSA